MTRRRKQRDHQADETSGPAPPDNAAVCPAPLAAANLNPELAETGEISAINPSCLALLEALCCVMASDGSISGREKRAISQVLFDVRAPLEPNELEQHLADFVSRVQSLGFRTVLDKAAADLRGYADQIDEKQMFLRALSSGAKADDKSDPKERRVIGRLWDALGAS